MDKKNILVFPCGSEIGLEIHRALGFNKMLKLYGGSSVDSNHGKYVFENYIDNIPQVDHPDFIEQINLIIDKYNIDFIFPAHDSVVLFLGENRNLISCTVVGSDYETCDISRSKGKTYEFMKGKILTPKVYFSKEDVSEFPVFLKPDVGQGSKGTYLVHNMEELEFYLKQDPSLLILEYLPGKEFTIDCFTDRHGELKFVGVRERTRVSNGISVNTVQIKEDEKFKRIANIINSLMEFKGVWFFQLKFNTNNELSLLEIAPRVAGTMGYFRNLGVNLPLLSIYDLLGYEVKINMNQYSLEMDRALVSSFSSNLFYKNVYIDFDDTVICDGKVNTTLMSFVYQCLNEGKRLVLITRHKGDINTSLKKYRLQNLFDEVIHITDKRLKSVFIDPVNSILIDDSFAERNDIASQLGIATFDLDSIESLINPRR